MLRSFRWALGPVLVASIHSRSMSGNDSLDYSITELIDDHLLTYFLMYLLIHLFSLFVQLQSDNAD